MGQRFASLLLAQRFSFISCGFATQDKASVYALLLSTRLSVSPPRVSVSHCRTRLMSTLLLSPPGSSCLLAKSQACTAEQGLGPRFASLLLIQYFSLTSCRLEPQDKAWVYAFPLSTRLIVSLRRVVGSHHRTRFWFMFCLSPPSSACLLAETRAPTLEQGLALRFTSLHQPHTVCSPSHGLAPHNKAGVHVLPLSTRLSVCPCQVADRTAQQVLGRSFASLQ